MKEKDHPTLPILMKSYMDLDGDGPMILHLIEEVCDFKKFIAPYIISGRNKLQGHSKGSQFRFFLHENGWPLMQYKLAWTKKSWRPTHAPCIKLWKEDKRGMPMLPLEDAEPLAVKLGKLKHEAELLKDITSFLAYYNKLLKAEVSPTFKAQQPHFVEYWTEVRDAIKAMSSGSATSDREITSEDKKTSENTEPSISNESNDDNNDTQDRNGVSTVQEYEVQQNQEPSSEEDLQGLNTQNQSQLRDVLLRFGFWPRT